MNLRFFIFRHGETDWNALKKFQGHTNIPLNEKGEKQAYVLANKVSGIDLKVVLSSDLQRAVKTAEIALAGRGIPIRLCSELRETHFGNAEGLTLEEIIEKFGDDLINKWRSVDPNHSDCSFPGGEKKSDHLGRVKSFLESYALSFPHQEGDCIGISTHGGTLVRIVHSCENAPAQLIPIPNCVMYEVAFNLKSRKWTLIGEVIGS